jgi:hypothetical protein
MWSDNLKGRYHFGSVTGRWKDTIRMDLSETGCRSKWIILVEVRIQLWVFVDMTTCIFHKSIENFFTSLATEFCAIQQKQE